jgi:Xaa-Pro aminopeptidase
MEEAKLDGLLVSVPVDDPFGRHGENRYWLSGFTGTAGSALVTRDKALLIADFRYTEQAATECAPYGFEVFPALGGMKEWFPKLAAEGALAGRTLGISRGDMSYGSFLSWQEHMAELPTGERFELVPAPPIVEKLRARKDAFELASLQRAIDLADASFEALLAELSPEQTERQVAGLFEQGVIARGGEGPSFATIVAAGPHAAMPHAQPTDDGLGQGRTIVIDMGARADGFCSDLTRTVVLGEPDAKFHEIYGIVFEAQQYAIEHVEAGMTGAAAHQLAMGVIERYGYGERFGHGLGHGVGLEVHEHPYLGPSSEDILEEGMVFTIEPGIYLPGWGGVRIEDVVILEKGRARVLSHAPKLKPAGA